MRLAGMMAADKRVDGFELVDEVVLKQKIQRAIYRWRRRYAGAVLEPIEQIVGLDRNRCLGDELEYAMPECGETQAALITNPGDIAHE